LVGDEQSPRVFDGKLSEDGAQEPMFNVFDVGCIPDAGWPDLSEDQQIEFENELKLWLQGAEGTTRQRLRIASWRFFRVKVLL
jgi:hypothetical protein